MEARVRFSVNWCWSRSHLKAQLFLYLINSFFFLTLLHRVSRQFQIGSDFSWHCLIVCVTIWLLLKRTKRRHRRCGWVTDSFCLEHIDRKVRLLHTKKAKKKSKIKLASSRYIVFSNQAEINQVKTERTKISRQLNTSLCMQ